MRSSVRGVIVTVLLLLLLLPFASLAINVEQQQQQQQLDEATTTMTTTMTMIEEGEFMRLRRRLLDDIGTDADADADASGDADMTARDASESGQQRIRNESGTGDGSSGSEKKECHRQAVQEDSDPCKYVKDYCQQISIFPYNQLFYCSLQNAEWFGYLFYLLLMFIYFIFVANLAYVFFIPSLQTWTKWMKLSQNVAGVTLLAIGNGAPDLFTAFAAFSSRNMTLGFGQLCGGAMFVLTIVFGIISISTGFEVSGRPFFRDVVFLMGAIVFVFVVNLSGEITLGHAIGFLAYYVAYVLVVIYGRKFYQKYKSDPRFSFLVRKKAVPSTPTDYGSIDVRVNETDAPDQVEGFVDDDDSEKEDDILEVKYHPFHKPFWAHFYHAGWIWPHQRPIERVIAFLGTPITFIVVLFCSKVDLKEPKNNWNKYMQTIQLALFLPFITWSFGFHDLPIAGEDVFFPVWLLALCFGITLAIINFFVTKVDPPPTFHFMFSIPGFIVAALWLGLVCIELVGVIETFGLLIGINASFLGITVLAWSNSLGDLITDLSMAKRGYTGAGVSATIASPLMTHLIAPGLSVLYLMATAASTAPIPMELDRNLMLAYPSILTILLWHLCVVPIMGFTGGKRYGWFLIAFYMVFMVLSILALL